MVETNTQIDIGAVKKRLLDYREMEREIDNQIERIENLEAKMISIGSPEITDMPKAPSSSFDKIGRMIARKDEMERKVRKLIEHQEIERRWIESVLQKLDKANERAVIRMRYLDVESWCNVSKMLFGANDDYEERQDSYMSRTTKLHGRALVSMAAAEGTGYRVT